MKMEIPICRKCGGKDKIGLRRMIKSNGSIGIFWLCKRCNCNATSQSIAHTDVRKWLARANNANSIDDIPIHVDYREQGEPCEVCGELGTEYHHFAPQSMAELFGDDWHMWPAVYLCEEHHSRWHSIVTWYMSGPGKPHPEMVKKYGNGQ